MRIIARLAFLCLLAASLTTLGCSSKMTTVQSAEWGTVDGHPVTLYTLNNGNGVIARITDFGATLVELYVPDARGDAADVVLGFDSVQKYNSDADQYFGCTVGRCGNRIAKGKFTLDGKQYTLATNNGPNHLHGGVRGWSDRVWSAKTAATPDGAVVRFTYTSPDGEEGYPGNVVAQTTYTLTPDNELIIEMTATTDAPTVINMVHHTYWNLAGHASGSVADQTLQLSARTYTPADDTLIPTGQFAPVAGTPYDFTAAKPIGKDIAFFKDGKHDETGGGYDLNYVVDGTAGQMRHVATATDRKSGRVMTITSAQPGVQFYTGNWIKDIAGKGGAVYQQHQGFCLETQHYPDAINHGNFLRTILRPGETYTHKMVHAFTTR